MKLNWNQWWRKTWVKVLNVVLNVGKNLKSIWMNEWMNEKLHYWLWSLDLIMKVNEWMMNKYCTISCINSSSESTLSTNLLLSSSSCREVGEEFVLIRQRVQPPLPPGQSLSGWMCLYCLICRNLSDETEESKVFGLEDVQSQAGAAATPVAVVS